MVQLTKDNKNNNKEKVTFMLFWCVFIVVQSEKNEKYVSKITLFKHFYIIKQYFINFGVIKYCLIIIFYYPKTN